MFNVERKTERFDLSSRKDLDAYDAILNDPSCTIVREIKEKISEKEMGDEGRITSIKEYLLLIVTYQRKAIME